mmetsp:Transcript_25620/g.42804  ORF Transcript_25620/g.42804 Transcript_25620/m.42804 type:complete len:107 (+) Transcript_25620:2220-2540(+)
MVQHSDWTTAVLCVANCALLCDFISVTAPDLHLSPDLPPLSTWSEMMLWISVKQSAARDAAGSNRILGVTGAGITDWCMIEVGFMMTSILLPVLRPQWHVWWPSPH